MDGYTKFFMEMKGDRDKISSVLNTQKGYKSEDIEEEEEEEKEEEGNKNKEAKQTYLNPSEVCCHLCLLKLIAELNR